MIDHGFKDDQEKNAIAQNEIEDWFEKLIQEEEAAEKLERDGYSYREALALVQKYGLSNLEREEL